MKRFEPESVGDILRELFQDNCMQEKLDERKAIELWNMAVGEGIASQCRRPEVKEGKMTVAVTNASLRHELNMSRTSLRNTINQLIGKETIKDIRFIS